MVVRRINSPCTALLSLKASLVQTLLSWFFFIIASPKINLSNPDEVTGSAAREAC